MREELQGRLIRNFDEVKKEPATHAPLYDGGMGGRVIGPRVAGAAAIKLGASIDVLPPGKAGCPYHFHYAQEEMFVVLQGEGTLRVAGEFLPLKSGDVVCIPPGPEYPHQLINTSDAPFKYLSISTQEFPEVAEYPDSGKYMAFTPVAGPLLQRGRMHRAETDLEYWDGEP